MNTASEQLAQGVRTRLGTITNLPTFGWVAGQAVCNAVLEQLGKATGLKCRDVDIFVHEKDRVRLAQFAPANSLVGKLVGTVRRGIRPRAADYSTFAKEAGWDDEYGMLAFQSRNAYRILDSRMQGKANYISFQPIGHRLDKSPTWDEETLLKTMDLNCVQAALNLETGRLFWTDEFQKFVETLEIRVSNFDAPVSALLRALSKQGEIAGSTFNFTRAIHELALRTVPYDSSTRDMGLQEMPSFDVPSNHEATLQKHYDKMSAHFARSEKTKPKDATAKQLNLLTCPPEEGFKLSRCFKAAWYDNGNREWMVASRILYGDYRGAQLEVVKAIGEHPSYTPLKAAVGFYGEAFVDADATVDSVQEIIDFMQRRPFAGIHRFSTMSEWLKAMRFIEAAEHRNGRWVSGLFDQMRYREWRESEGEARRKIEALHTDFARKVPGGFALLSEQEFDEAISKAVPYLGERLASVFQPRCDVPEGCSVRSLTTRQEIWEAEFDYLMRWSGLTPGVATTCSVVLTTRDESSTFYVYQGGQIGNHYGPDMSEPSQEHKVLAERLVRG